MQSPFPGVDPYLESQHYWPDFHATFIATWREAINDALPDSYEARIDERVQIVDLAGRGDRIILPDVAVIRQDVPPAQPRGSTKRDLASPSAAILEYPLMAEVRETMIEILHRPEKSLVTVLELLSPTNKTNPGRGQYLAKRNELLTQPVHLVEVDLLAGGEGLPMRRPLPSGDYHAIVSRSERLRSGEVYAWTVKDRLPIIPIPLLSPDEDIVTDLGAVFRTAFERGSYTRSINYGAALEMPLADERKRWAEELAKRAMTRSN